MFETPPLQSRMTDITTGYFTREWSTWFSKIQNVLKTVNAHGTTAQRPTTGLYIGMMYFDDTLGFPVWLQSVGPDVWVRYDGVAA